MKITIKKEIFIERERTLTIRFNAAPAPRFCRECRTETNFVNVNQAAVIAQTTARHIFRLIEDQRLHHAESTEGFLLVCLTLAARGGRGNQSKPNRNRRKLMKTLKIIATFTVLAAAVVGAAFAQENRGLRRGENFGRFPQSAARTGAPENQSERINLAPDAPDSFGKLDPTFGTGGKVTTVLPDNDEPRTIKMQPDGNILVTGYALDSNGYIIKTYVVRYNQNGTLDTGFAGGGVYRVDYTDVGIYDAAATPDGKILLAADKFNAARGKFDFAVYRLNANGTLDTTFGTNGALFTAIANNERFSALLILPNGKIVQGGTIDDFPSTFARFALRRLNADGTIDTNFGSNGIVSTAFNVFN